MKKIICTVILIGLAVCVSTCSYDTPMELDIQVSNPSNKARIAQTVVINLKECLPRTDLRGLTATMSCGEKDVIVQIDDLDNDGSGDELTFTTDLVPHEQKKFHIDFSYEKATETPTSKVNAYIKLNDIKGQHPKVQSITYPGDANLLDMYNSIYGHGAVFENEYMAYRIYMDNRQSIDIYGKTTPQLEMETTGFYTTEEQMNEGYGCDILWAGKSVGAGSFRGIYNNEPCYIDSVNERQQSIIASGPIRTIVEVADNGWLYNGRKVNMTQRYSLYAGRREIMVEVIIDGAPEGEQFYTGIQKLENNNSGFILDEILTGNLCGSWGSNIPDKSKPHLSENVGLGLYVNPENCVSMHEDSLNYLVRLRTDNKNCIRYFVATCAGRETNGFKNAEQWFNYLTEWQEEMAQPCIVELLH